MNKLVGLRTKQWPGVHMEWPKITHSLFSNMMQDFIMYEDRKKGPYGEIL